MRQPVRSSANGGSGFGVVACLAAELGFRASGIEIERGLVDGATQLANDFDVPADFVCGSFVPEGGEEFLESIDGFAWLIDGGRDGYDLLELAPDDFDVIFAYPWPGEEHVVIDLFDRYAATGAILVTFHGRDGLQMRRKVPDRRRRRH